MPASLQAKKQRAQTLIQNEQLTAAKALLEEITRSGDRDTAAWYMLAAANHRLGLYDEAARCYKTVIELLPRHPAAYYYLGNIRGEQSDHAEAIRYYRKALELRPGYDEAALNLGGTLQRLQRNDEAIECYLRFLQHGAASADIYTYLGNACADTANYDAAIDAYRKALSLDPNRPDVYMSLAHALAETGKLDDAIEHYEKLVSVDTKAAAAHRYVGAILTEQGKTKEALERYRRALAIAPDMVAELRSAMMLPVIPASMEELQNWRKRFETEVSRLEAEEIQLTDPVKEIAATNFYLSYHGLNNRELHRKVARLYQRACPSLLWTAPHCAEAQPTSRKIRVGFISRHMYNHSVGKTTRGLLQHLSRDKFEVFSLLIPPVRDDETSKFIRAHSDASLAVPETLEEARSAVAALKLDILFYQDIGMEPFTYVLAFSRLAPVQCASFGHPDTSGIPSIDYFISDSLFEIPDAQQHYNEKLFLLRDLGNLAYYYRPALPASMKQREDFGLPADKNIYICPQTPFKFHPDFDAFLGNILRADPHGQLILLEGHVQHRAKLLQQRCAAAFPDVSDRLVFLPPQKGPDFTNLIALADVMLDTIHFNGYNTSLEAFSVGTPVVTMPTAFQRGRHTAGMYRKMGLEECTASSAEEYVRLAVKLGTETDYRQHIKDEIERRSEVLFENMQVVREFERFFQEALATAQAR